MGDTQPATMEEIALKLWALRTGKDSADAVDGKTVPLTPPVPLTQAKARIEGRAAN